MNRSDRFAVDIEEVEYLAHGDAPLSARIYRPRGAGPFPALLEAHGGAWCVGDRRNNETVNLPLAAAGIVVVAVDYRLPPQATYPGSVADVNYAIRWLKHHAPRFGSRAALVGALGTSAGGHLTLLNALKPGEPRYAAIPFAEAPRIDARVPYVVSLWPVLCPLDSYCERRDYESAGGGYKPGEGGGDFWARYWLSEAAMSEGSPLLALERGDRVELPAAFYMKNAHEPADARHTTPQALVDRFVAAYRRAGGAVEVEYFEGEDYDHIRTHPESPAAARAIEQIVGFVRRQCAQLAD